MNVEILYRTLKEIDAASDNQNQDFDPGSEKKEAFLHSPLKPSRDVVFQIAGTVDGKIVGGEYVFPLKLCCCGQELTATVGSTLYVPPEFRSTGLGLELPNLCLMIHPDEISTGAGVSQMALPVYKFLEYAIFYFPRLIFLRKSRSVVEHFVKWKPLQIMIRPVVDLFLSIGRGFLSLCTRIATWSYSFRRVEADDLETLTRVAELAKDDAFAFSEVHDVAWFRWHLRYSFAKQGTTALYVVLKQGEIVGFYMTKTRFYPQASHRGFRNVWLGSIIEWGCAKNHIRSLKWFLLNAVLSFGRGIDAVEISTDDDSLLRFLRRIKMRQVGCCNFIVKAAGDSPLRKIPGWDQQSEWRLRPAMCDNGIS